MCVHVKMYIYIYIHFHMSVYLNLCLDLHTSSSISTAKQLPKCRCGCKRRYINAKVKVKGKGNANVKIYICVRTKECTCTTRRSLPVVWFWALGVRGRSPVVWPLALFWLSSRPLPGLFRASSGKLWAAAALPSRERTIPSTSRGEGKGGGDRGALERVRRAVGSGTDIFFYVHTGSSVY